MYIAGGWLSLALAFLGIFLPLLPTTPFVLLAAACFSRGSERLHQWLLAQPTFGPLLRDWQQHGVIRLRVKCVATILMVLLLSYPIGYGPIPLWAKGAMVLVGISVLGFIWSRPSHDNP
jgi:uncharacterized membrane protein YbaN (DUF454 family)